MEIISTFLEIKDEFYRIYRAENRLHGNLWKEPDGQQIYNDMLQIHDFIGLSLIPRSFYRNSVAGSNNLANESVAAHTLTVIAFLDKYIQHRLHSGMSNQYEQVFGYSYREMIEAAKRHDLAENILGDIPDNGMRDDSIKNASETDYWRKFSRYSPNFDSAPNSFFETRVNDLLGSMNRRDSPAGRMLYVVDKISAILTMLTYNLYGAPALIDSRDSAMSGLDAQTALLCDFHMGQYCKASEMWTISFLKIRKNSRYDGFGYPMAILIMSTLAISGGWYSWREKDYENLI